MEEYIHKEGEEGVAEEKKKEKVKERERERGS